MSIQLKSEKLKIIAENWHDDYYAYLASLEWREAKWKGKIKWGQRCLICGSRLIEWHHLDYQHLWMPSDYLSIRPVCRDHHQRLHFTILTHRKIPLTKRDLHRRYHFYKWYYFFAKYRPSDFFNLFSFIGRL